ncbi:MAG: excinuclease ABC subunit C, partial [Chitinophagales bacterium]
AETLKSFNKKSTVANSSIKNIDVYHLLEVEQKVFVQHMKVKHGSIVSARCFEVKRKLNESKEELLCYAIENDIAEGLEMGTEVIVPFEITIEGIKTHIPKTGDKHKILLLAFKNLIAQKQHYFNLKKKAEEKPAAQKRILRQVQADLRLKELPIHIECFDNSNIQGTNPVASMVIFRNAKPAKKDYRHYKIKTVEGPNDFASMEEVVYRRYKRLLDEEQSLPQLIIVDGGKGQLSSAVKSLKKLDIYGKVAIVGIAKRLEEIFYPGDTLPLFINKKSESLKLIQQLRNEAHRFAITFHRNLRSKNAGKSQLEDIQGIGTKTTQTLLREFESVEKIKQATFDELSIFIGEAKAKIVYGYFQNTPK